MKKVVLIKLGGSVITNKDIPLSLRKNVLTRLVQEIAYAREKYPEISFVVGHGHGSFAHVPASKYQTKQGFINDESVYGMTVVLDSVAQLNRTVIHEFLRADIPAAAVRPNNSLVTNNRQADTFFTDVFEQYLKAGVVPITCGDVLMDRAQGCTIWSTEEVLSFFAHKFQQRDWEVQKVIHVTDVPGVMDEQGKTIERITQKDWVVVEKALGQAKGFDVTGGMVLKLQQSLQLAESGITSLILSGLEENNLRSALTQQSWVGTTVTN